MAPRRRTRPGVVPVPSAEARPRVRLSGPGALVACLPQLIGFEPVESLVLVGLVPGRARQARGRPHASRRPRRRRATPSRPLLLDDDGSFDDERLTLDPDGHPAAYLGGRTAGPLAPCHPLSLVAALVRNRCVAAQVVVVSDRARPPGGELALGDLGCYLVAVVDAGPGRMPGRRRRRGSGA